jgi:MscS family membrane protein
MDYIAEMDQAFTAWLGGGTWALVAQVFLVVLTVVVANYLTRKLLARLRLKTEQTRSRWDDAIVDAVERPAALLVWVLGLTFVADIIHARTEATIFEAVDPLRTVGVIACLAWFLVRMVRNVEDVTLRQAREAQTRADPTTVHAIGKLVRLSIIITAALMGLQSLGFSISGVLAFGGIGGIAVGFAAKDLLANFFGGLMIYLDRPFAVGDWIRSPDKQIEGTVEEVGWRLTRIRTFDKRPLYVPNSFFTQITVENPSRMTHRRIYETIGIRYDDLDKMPAVVKDVREMLQAHPEIDQSQTLMVNFNAFNDSSLDFFVYTFTRTTVWAEYHRVKEDVLLKIAEIIEGHGAEVAFPTRTLHLAGTGEAAGALPADVSAGVRPAS